MKDRLQQEFEALCAERRRDHLRRFVALGLVLAILASLFAGWDLRRPGYALSDEDGTVYYCGKEEHIHDASCYKEELICGYADGELVPVGANASSDADRWDTSADEEPAQSEPEPAEPEEPAADSPAQDDGIALYEANGEANGSSESEEVTLHHHTSACYQEKLVLTCDEPTNPDHPRHDELCYDQETGELICPYHVHDASCYTLEDVLTCGYEEGEPETASSSAASVSTQPESYQPQPVVVETPADSDSDSGSSWEEKAPAGFTYHHHTDACYGEVLICGKEEHIHTDECRENPNAAQDETYEAQTPARTADDWPASMVEVARSQLGYTESTTDVDADGKGYTLYAAQYYADKPATYADWDASFVSYCLYHAGVPSDVVPQYAGVEALCAELEKNASPYYHTDTDTFGAIRPGDLVLYPNADGRTTIGVAEETTADADGQTTALTAISGDVTKFDYDTDQAVDKVAEVPVTLADVTGFVSVNAAYAAAQAEGDEEGGTEGGTTTPAEGEDDPTQLKNLITKMTLRVKPAGTQEFVDWPENYQLQENDSIRIDVEFKTRGSETFPTNADGTQNATLTYQLPLKLAEALSNVPIYRSASDQTQIGDYNVSKDGLVTLNFLTEQVNLNQVFEGSFWLEQTVDLSGLKDGETITFPGLETSITIHRPEDYEIAKKAVDGIIKKENGVNYIEYQVVVSSKNGTGNNKISLSDEIMPKDGIQGSYSDFALVHRKADGTQETLAIDPDLKSWTSPAQELSGDPMSSGVWAGYSVFTERISEESQSFFLPDLPPLAEGEQYVLTYRYRLNDDSALDGTVKNTATVHKDDDDTGKTADTTTTFKKALEKKGEYDAEKERVKWTITIRNPNKESLSGKWIQDALERDSNATLLGKIQVNAGDSENSLHNVASWSAADATQRPATPDPDESDTGSVESPTGDNLFFEHELPAKEDGSYYAYYQLVYYTTAPTDEAILSNAVSFDERTAEAEVNLTSGARTWSVSKSPSNSTNFERVEKTINGETKVLSRMKWYATIRPERGTTQFTVTDTFLDPVSTVANDIDPNDNYALYGELKVQLENDATMEAGGALEFYMTGETTTEFLDLKHAKEAGVQVKFRYYSDIACSNQIAEGAPADTHVKAFQIDVDTSNSTAGNVYKLNIGDTNITNPPYRYYSSYVNISKTGFTTENEWVIKNTVTASANDYTGTATGSYLKYQGKKELKKYVGTDQKVGTGTKLTVDYGKPIWYGLLLKTDFKSDTITLTDTLPAGMTFDPNEAGSYVLLFKRRDGSYLTKPDACADRPYASVAASVATGEDGRQTVTFTITGVQNIPEEHRTFDGIQVSFQVSVTSDEYWKDYTHTTKGYDNTASWEGVATTDPAKVTVKRDGTFFANKSVVNTGDKSRVSYVIDVNPEGRKLLGEGGNNSIKLTDTFTVPKNVTAEIDRSDVQWLDADGNDQSAEYNEKFEILPSATKENGETVYTMVFTLPDGVHLKIKYTYQLTFGTNAGQNITVTNAANLEGQSNKATSTSTQKVSGGASGMSSGQLIVYKVDSRNAATTLSGAHFKLERYTTSGSWETVNADMVTDAKGRLLFAPAAASGYQALDTNALYRLTETIAPQNYNLNPEPVYFLWLGKNVTNTEANQQEALNAATGGSTPEGVANIHYILYGQNNSLDVQDVFNTKLTLTKQWADCLGEPLAEAPDLPVTLKLYRTSIADPQQGTEEVPDVGDIVLNKANNWTAQLDDLDPNYTYTVEEQPLEGGNEEGYLPLYTYSDGAKVTTAAPYNGTVTVTNTENPGLPMVEKKVRENVKSTNPAGTETDRHIPEYAVPAQYNDVADYSMGDTVPFQLVGTLPEDLKQYSTYFYEFVDTQSPGLTLDEGSVQVKLARRDGTAVADADLTASAAVSKTADGFCVTFNDLLAALGSNAEAVKASPLQYCIVVDYTATLNQKAVVGLDGNVNRVYLCYSNDSVEPSNVGYTAEDEVIVFTYQLSTTKVDENNAALSGVGFVLSRRQGEQKEYAQLDEQARLTGWTTDAAAATTLTSGEDGTFRVVGLDDGTYTLTETAPRPGYNALLADITVALRAATAHSQAWSGITADALTGLSVTVQNAQSGTASAADGTANVSITNRKGTLLPSTGGTGTLPYYLVGGGLMAAAALLLLAEKRRNNKQ